MNISSCVKAACLKAVVFTIPSKEDGLRIQSTDVFLGDPGLGKGLGWEWRERLLKSSKAMLLDYADQQYRDAMAVGDDAQGEARQRDAKPVTFKYVDGVVRLVNMELPFLVDLPNGSCEAVFVTGARNRGSGVIPILEYLKDKQTLVDKKGTNGIFLGSHDATMLSTVFKTTESVPTIQENYIF